MKYDKPPFFESITSSIETHVVCVSTFSKKEKETSNANLVHMTKKCPKNAIETAEDWF